MNKFNPHSDMNERAVQAWPILVGKAMNRQTITYEGLSVLMYGYEAQGTLDKILAQIAYYCEGNGHPRLTVIVVGKGRGTPGAGYPWDRSTIDEDREKVYNFDWFNLHPPSKTALQKAYEANA